MIKVGDAAHKSFLVFNVSDSLNELLQRLKETNCTYLLVTDCNQVEKVIHISYLVQQIAGEGSFVSLEDIMPREEFILSQESDPIEILLNIKDSIKLVVVVDQDKNPVGIIDNILGISKLLQGTIENVPGDSLSLMEYRGIVEQFEEEIFITDGEGIILYLNMQAEKICQVKLADVIGKHVSDMEKAGAFTCSTTLGVLKTRNKVNMLQKLKSGNVVFATGLPIFDNEGRLHRIISTSKDVSEINHLITEIEQKNKEIRNKNQELTLLKEGIFAQDNFVCSSPEMMAIKDTIIKIGPTDISVMIQGETGVGKEIVAKLIHNLSRRNRHSLIKINCGLIPENLIESELFGYEGGAFTGANKNGKIGKIELAHQGTLFLDEIGEMPLSLQVKILEFLQDREIVRVGGTKKIKIDTRIIVATNRILQDMVDQGTFRSDLFYRLNVLPINIPPLRERQEDIPLLVQYFLDTHNDKYKMNKRLDPEVEKALYQYDWPGNVRELIHFMERIIVTSDTEIIMPEILPEILSGKGTIHQKITCNDLMPLKKAKSEVEAQLVLRAYEIYKSTYKAGKALEIDQSTVVKLLKKHGYKKD